MVGRFTRSLVILTCLVQASGLAAPALAQDKPRHGGELVFVVAAEPPSFDGHREETFAMLHPIAPHYNTLLRTDPADRTGTKFVGDLAESWTISPDKRAYTFKLRRGVKFHDGSAMTAADVKASYDHIVFPPAGVSSSRQAQYKVVEAVEAPSAVRARRCLADRPSEQGPRLDDHAEPLPEPAARRRVAGGIATTGGSSRIFRISRAQ